MRPNQMSLPVILINALWVVVILTTWRRVICPVAIACGLVFLLSWCVQHYIDQYHIVVSLWAVLDTMLIYFTVGHYSLHKPKNKHVYTLVCVCYLAMIIAHIAYVVSGGDRPYGRYVIFLDVLTVGSAIIIMTGAMYDRIRLAGSSALVSSDGRARIDKAHRAKK